MCPRCGTVLLYRCKARLFPWELCAQHGTAPMGPACKMPEKKVAAIQAASPAELIAEHLPPEARHTFGVLLRNTAPADVLKLVAARQAARLITRMNRGTLSPGEEAHQARTLAHVLEKEANIRLADKELNPPKVNEVQGYDYSRLSEAQRQDLQKLLELASVAPVEDGTALPESAHVSEVGIATAVDALYPRRQHLDPEDAARRQRKSKGKAKRKAAAK